MSKRKIIYYVAQSQDGFIARTDGGVDWLLDDQDYGYFDFIAGIDCVVMGRKTYEQILAWDIDWPYPDQKSVICGTRNTDKDPEGVIWTKDAVGFLEKEMNQPGKDIWLVGGGGLASSLLKADLIDELWLYIHPLYLGEGRPVYSGTVPESWWALNFHKAYTNGLIELRYQRNRES